MTAPRALPALVGVLLAGCQVTTFEHAPVAAAAGCDPALVGRWVGGDEGGEVELAIAPDCTLRVAERENDGWKIAPKPATPLRVGRHGEHAYAWVDARWGLVVADEADRSLPAGDVVVVRYRVAGDTLSLWTPDDRAIAHAIVDGDLTGRTEVDGHDIVNRLPGRPAPDVLDHPGFFEADPETFRRREGG